MQGQHWSRFDAKARLPFQMAQGTVKGTIVLYCMFVQGLIYRFEFLMVVTLLCAALTVVFFVISSVNEAQWKFGEQETTVEISSKSFLFLVYPQVTQAWYLYKRMYVAYIDIILPLPIVYK